MLSRVFSANITEPPGPQNQFRGSGLTILQFLRRSVSATDTTSCRPIKVFEVAWIFGSQGAPFGRHNIAALLGYAALTQPTDLIPSLQVSVLILHWKKISSDIVESEPSNSYLFKLSISRASDNSFVKEMLIFNTVL